MINHCEGDDIYLYGYLSFLYLLELGVHSVVHYIFCYHKIIIKQKES